MKKKYWVGWRVCAAILLIAAFWGMGMNHASAAERADVHSYSTPEIIQITDIDLTLSVDFESKKLFGTAMLIVQHNAAGPLVLDTRDLTIKSVISIKNGHMGGVPYILKPADPILGSALQIQVPSDCKMVLINYETSPKASALQWLEASRTAGGQKPFMFSQSEAIHARSWIPCQDSPAVRVRYKANIEVPEGFVALMAADRGPVIKGRPKPGFLTYRFTMNESIPPYLIALAVGDLKFQAIGKRTGVWAEPSVVDKAAYEFADTEKMVEAAEARFGPYRWGRYDILVLPPSFPFGGMENPKLTFATPTVIAGDRSLVALIAHELAHSWSGNLVTNATWRDFWLNEGFTTYGERRIVEALYGKDLASIERVLGFADLKEELNEFKPGDQILHIKLDGRDPDDGMTRVPYEKGALFLTTLEDAFGREAFDSWLKSYFDRHAFKSITTADFVADLKANLFPTKPEAAAKIDLETWLEKPGLPEKYAIPKSAKLLEIRESADLFAKGKAAKAIDTKDWTTHEWLQFLRTLPEKLSPAQMADLDATFELTKRGNSEIASQWLQMAIRNEYKPADERVELFLTTIGRRKFLMPLYKELVKTEAGKARAKAIYAKARNFYHPIAVDSVDKLVGKP
jgi:aminopeptidase N